MPRFSAEPNLRRGAGRENLMLGMKQKPVRIISHFRISQTFTNSHLAHLTHHMNLTNRLALPNHLAHGLTAFASLTCRTIRSRLGLHTGSDPGRCASCSGRRPVIDIGDLQRAVEDAVFDFCILAEGNFTFDAVREEVIGKVGHHDELEDLIVQALDDNDDIFFDYRRGTYIPREHFFFQRKFIISLTELERRRGILIPGHRFAPFSQPLLPPSKYGLSWQRGKDLPTKQISISLKDLHIFFSLFDYARMVEFLIVEDERNTKVLLSPTIEETMKVFITVYDISSVLEANPKLTIIEATIESWECGIYRLRPAQIDRSPEGAQKLDKWCQNLEEVLNDEVLTLLGTEVDINEQLSWAFFLGPSNLSRKPRIHMGGFLEKMKNLELIRLKGVPMLWYRDEGQLQRLQDAQSADGAFEGVLDSIDGILVDIGCNLRQVEIEAYMRDNLFMGRKNLDEVQDRIVATRLALQFVNPIQEDSFNALFEDLWINICAIYNRFTDQRPGKIRHECLILGDKLNHWMARLNFEGKRLDLAQKKEFMAMTSLASMLFHTLHALNQQPCDVSSEELNSLMSTLPTLVSQANQLMQTIDQQLAPPKAKQANRPVFRVIKGGKDEG